MDLCGWALPTVLGIVAFVLFLALAAGRPHKRGQWWTVPARVSMLVALNLLVLAIVGALLNDQYAFYTNWSDLAGGSPPSKTEHYGGTPSEAQATVSGATLTAKVPSSLPKLPQPGRRVQHYRVVGARSHLANEVLVRLPEHYDPSSAQRYPVILALHGFPGHPQAFGQLGGFFNDLDSAARNRRMAGAIVVMPLINHPSTLDTECVDAPGGPQTETWLSHDIPQWVMSHFAARAGRQSWVTYGYSFGGWCAAMLGMRHPDVFGGAVVFQGYFRPEFDRRYQPFRVGSVGYARYDLVSMARRKSTPLALWVFASKQDRISYPSTREFISAARAPMSITADLPEWGGHRISVWEDKIPQTLTWLGHSLSGFRA